MLCCCVQSHAFHMIFTAVIALAFYQTVIAIARSEASDINFWTVSCTHCQHVCALVLHCGSSVR